jgi:hypothetical protein
VMIKLSESGIFYIIIGMSVLWLMFGLWGYYRDAIDWKQFKFLEYRRVLFFFIFYELIYFFFCSLLKL